jgi:DNA-binding transcriptional ArsR family regulator
VVNYQQRLDTTFGALADPIRRELLAKLARQGESSVSTLAQPHPISLPAIMKHLGVLERAGLISWRKDGRTRHCRLVSEALQQAGDWIDQYRSFWEGQLDSLDKYLEQQTAQEALECPHPKPQQNACDSRESSPRRGKKSSARGRKPAS